VKIRAVSRTASKKDPLAEGEGVRGLELLVLEAATASVENEKQDRPQGVGERRIKQAQADQDEHDAVGRAAHRQQREAEHRVDDEHVARPEEPGMNEADREQHREAPRIDQRRMAAGPRRFEAGQLQVEADAEQQAEHQVELAGEEEFAQRVDEPVDAARVDRRRREHRMREAGMFIMKMPNSATPRSTSSAAMRSAAGSGRLARRRGFGFGVHGPTVANAARGLSARSDNLGHFDVSYRHCRQPAQALLACRDREALARVEGRRPELERAKADATLLWLKVQEDAGLTTVGDGEQSRQHFVHGFLAQVEGIDFEHKVKMGIRDNRYDAMVPQVVGPLRLSGPGPRGRGAPRPRAIPTGCSSSRCPAR
jgi:hypothetical protein